MQHPTNTACVMGCNAYCVVLILPFPFFLFCFLSFSERSSSFSYDAASRETLHEVLRWRQPSEVKIPHMHKPKHKQDYKVSVLLDMFKIINATCALPAVYVYHHLSSSRCQRSQNNLKLENHIQKNALNLTKSDLLSGRHTVILHIRLICDSICRARAGII